MTPVESLEPFFVGGVGGVVVAWPEEEVVGMVVCVGAGAEVGVGAAVVAGAGVVGVVGVGMGGRVVVRRKSSMY